jgi:cytochrome c2
MSKRVGSICAIMVAASLAACNGQNASDRASVNVSATSKQQPAPPAAFAQCRACHSPEPGRNGIGPSLAGVFGSKAATVAGYTFSPAMQRSGLTWDEVTLDRYLKAPRQVVPGTRMSFPGIQDDAQRAAVIAYLETLR